jgi:hypothetical protein
MNAVIIFAKYPKEGKVKTRLAKTLGSGLATNFYKNCAENTLKICLSLPAENHSLYLFYTDADEKIFFEKWVNERFILQLQKGKDLGERMKNAFQILFKNHFKKVVIVGTDCPELTKKIIKKSFSELFKNDVVIGPSNDGGYYLLGMNQFYPFLFDGIKWSTETVFTETLKIFKINNLNYSLLPTLVDVDTEEDLKLLPDK